MLKLLFIFTFLLCSTIAYCFEPQSGDIFFQESISSDFTDAIKGVTKSAKKHNFSHCGIAYVDSSSKPPAIYVIEAIPETGVTITPLSVFLQRDTTAGGKPMVAVGRLDDSLKFAIPHSIEYSMKLRGKPYDYEFDFDNDKYYCSELLYFAFRDEKQQPIFKATPMTFVDAKSKDATDYWKEYFAKLGIPIPEGKMGVNPGGISRSKCIKIVHSYY
ncbi:MAG: hypothetical protein LBO69_09515 [Ignavibacteria bacterium]|nr:hypothetical protein [Ignavibacteria bacterium]